MAKVDPDGQGGAETQLAEVTRIKGSCVNSALWSMTTSAKSTGLMAFETLWDHRYR